MPGTWTLGTYGQAGAHGKSRTTGGESQIRICLIKAGSPEESVLQEGSADTAPGRPQCGQSWGSRSAVACALLWTWMVMLPRVLRIIHMEYFHLKGPQTGSAHRYRAEANTVASETPRKYSSKDDDVKITITHKEKEKLGQKAVRSDSDVII